MNEVEVREPERPKIEDEIKFGAVNYDERKMVRYKATQDKIARLVNIYDNFKSSSVPR